MKRIQDIIDRLKAIDGLQAAIETKATSENDGRFTAETQAEWDNLQTEYETLKAEKVTLEAQAVKAAESFASRDNRANDFQAVAIPRRANPGSSAPAAKIEGEPVDKHGGSGPPDAGSKIFVIPPKAMRYGSVKNFSGVIDGRNSKERAYRFGMYALARICQCLPGRFHIPQATQFVDDYMGGIRNTAHGESEGVTGSHVLVPEEFSEDLIVLREMYGVARRSMKRETMAGDTKHIPKRVGGLTASFVGESTAGTESNMQFQDILLVAKDLMALARISNQLSADAAIDLGDTLMGEIAYAFANKEDLCAFNGDGTSTYAGIRGIRTLLTDIDGAGTDSLGVVTQTTGNTWAQMVLADFDYVVGKLPQYADTPNAAWYCHKSFYAGVMQRLGLAAGGNSLEHVADGDRRPRPTFLGYPVEFSQVFPSVTATSGVMAILGDLTLSSAFGDRQQTAIAFSEHASVGGENVFERNQIAVRGTERFDISNHGCGTATTIGPVVGIQTS